MIFTDIIQLCNTIEAIRKGKTIVMASGTFDVFHSDHLGYLKGAKSVGDIVVVAVKSNKCAALKGPNRPIIDQSARIAIVDAIRYVDYTIMVDYNPDSIKFEIEADNKAQREWLTIFQNLFEALRPDILYHEDNPVLQSARERIFERYGIKGIKKERGKEYSTTDIIRKIKKMM